MLPTDTNALRRKLKNDDVERHHATAELDLCVRRDSSRRQHMANAPHTYDEGGPPPPHTRLPLPPSLLRPHTPSSAGPRHLLGRVDLQHHHVRSAGGAITPGAGRVCPGVPLGLRIQCSSVVCVCGYYNHQLKEVKSNTVNYVCTNTFVSFCGDQRLWALHLVFLVFWWSCSP